MDYTDVILKDNYYLEMCNVFLNLVKDEEIKEKLKELLYYGRVGKYTLVSGVNCKDNPSIEISRRISMAYLLINSPITFQYFLENNINIFHGTNANALATISQYGLGSIDYLRENGIEVKTGEEWSRIDGKRNFVSFSDVFDVAEGYSTIKTKENNDDLEFSVIIGTTKEEIDKTIQVPAYSDISEIAVKSHFPLESIKCICVPSDKVEFVKRVVNNSNIKVLGICNFDKKFYDFEEDFMRFYPDMYKRYKNMVSNNELSNFKEEEVRKVTFSRSLNGISKLLKKVKNMLNFTELDKESGEKLDEFGHFR